MMSGKASGTMKDDLILAEVEGEGMIIDVEKSASYFLNETALLIFKMQREGRSFDEIKAAFLAEYDVDEKEAEEDIKAFMVKFEKKVTPWERKNM